MLLQPLPDHGIIYTAGVLLCFSPPCFLGVFLKIFKEMSENKAEPYKNESEKSVSHLAEGFATATVLQNLVSTSLAIS